MDAKERARRFREHQELVSKVVKQQEDIKKTAPSDRLSLGGAAPWACLFPLGQSGQRTRPPLARVTGGAWRGAREIIPRKQAPTFSESVAQGVLPHQQAGVTGGKTVHQGCSLFWRAGALYPHGAC